MIRTVPLATLAICLVATAALAEPPALQTWTLRNGLQVVLAPDSAAATVDVTVCHAAGPLWEKAGLTGITGVYQRMIHESSRHFGPGEGARRLDAAGATYGASSGLDGTTSWQVLPPEELDLALRLAADRMAGLTPDAAGVARGTRRARDEQRARSAGGVSLAMQQLYASLFPGHPYGRSAGGDDTDLGRITPRDLSAWGRARFAANTATLIVTGRFTAESVRARIEALFGVLPGGRPASWPEAKPPAATPSAPRAVPGDQPVRELLVGWRGPGAQDPDAPVFELLQRLLAGTSRGRVAHAVMEDSVLAYNVQSSTDVRREASVLWVLAVLRPDADSSEVRRRVVDTVERLAAAPPTAEELEAARRGLLLESWLQAQTPHLRAAAIADAVNATGDPARADARLGAIRDAGPGDVQRVARHWLADHGPAIVWLGAARTGGTR